MSCFKMKKLRFKARIADAEAENQISARRTFLDSPAATDDRDDPILVFLEETVVEAEMERTRTHMALDRHIRHCLFCYQANSN